MNKKNTDIVLSVLIDMTYLRFTFEKWSFIFDFLILSTKIPHLFSIFVIYRLFDKIQFFFIPIKKDKIKTTKYVLVETVGVEPTSRHNGT